MSAGDAFEQSLRLAIVFENTAAYRAGATCILRRHRMNVAAQSQRLPIKLGVCRFLCLARVYDGAWLLASGALNPKYFGAVKPRYSYQW